MKNTFTSVSVSVAIAALTLGLGFTCVAQSTPQSAIKFFIVPAPTSPNDTASLANIVQFALNDWAVGSLDASGSPASLNPENVLRGSQIVFGPSTLFMWDATNAPTGAFASENGSRLGCAFKVWNPTLFTVSDGSFTNWSSDGYNTLGYGGNLATNTANGLPLTFSPTFRGQVWNGSTLIADYHNGESITNQVNLLVGVIRIGYYCTTMSVVQNDLNYFKSAMEMANGFAIRFPDGTGVTNMVSSVVAVDPPVVVGDGTVNIRIEGQRQLGLYYSLQQTLNVAPPAVWTLVETNVPEGIYNIPMNGGQGSWFYRVIETTSPFVSSAPIVPLVKGTKTVQNQAPLTMVGVNGPE